MPDTKAAAIVLAAGKGTRMKSKLPKVMHRIAGRTLIGHVLDHLQPLDLARVIAVIAPGMDDVAKEVAPHGVAYQAEQLGTGHAVGSARAALKNFTGDILVVYGDTPFVSTETLRRMFDRRREPDNPAIVVLGMRPVDPSGYGRLGLGDGSAPVVQSHDEHTIRRTSAANSRNSSSTSATGARTDQPSTCQSLLSAIAT